MNAFARTTALLACVGLAVAASPVAAAVPGFGDLHDFCSQAQCADGEYPAAPLEADAAGDLFGTTALGGADGWGTIFELVPRKKAGYKYKVLHSFCGEANCTDGSDPQSGLVIDTAGNLYGTTKFGGAQNGGTVFELVRRDEGKLKILHSFCAQGAACADGSAPMYDGLTYQGAGSGTPYDGVSPLYGTTIYGGENNAGYSGTVYGIAPRKNGKTWKETIVWQFCSETNCADGSQPHNGLVMDSVGDLYGVAFAGGNSSNDGVIFELSPGRSGWTETVLHDFCGAANCADGANPESPLLADNGGFAGAASSGGAHGGGALFFLVPDGTNSQYADTYDFCSLAECTDGSGPMGRIAPDAEGDLFGTALTGGDPNYSRGVVYELTTQRTLDVLHIFCAGGDCADGEWPVGGVTLDASQDIFGTASEGGSYSEGVIFEQTP
jgi:uncharacterized repeat protein (TIGR03803 family)